MKRFYFTNVLIPLSNSDLWHLIAPPLTSDFSGKVGLKLAFDWLLHDAVERLNPGDLHAVGLGLGSMSIDDSKRLVWNYIKYLKLLQLVTL